MKDSEWIKAVESLKKEVENAQSHGGYQRIILGGDLNFKNLKWDQEGYVDIDVCMSRQMELFSVLLNNNFLFNLVTKPTRGENILDLVCTNDKDLCVNMETEYNDKFSDHNMIKICTKLAMVDVDDEADNVEYLTNIPQFNWRNGSNDEWIKYSELMDEHDWMIETKWMRN